MYSVGIHTNDCDLGDDAWQRAEEQVRKVGGGFVAYRTTPELEPEPRHLTPADVSKIFPQSRRSAVPATFVTNQPDKRKHVVAELLPFLAAVVGIPLLFWVVDRQKEKEIRG